MDLILKSLKFHYIISSPNVAAPEISKHIYMSGRPTNLIFIAFIIDIDEEKKTTILRRRR